MSVFALALSVAVSPAGATTSVAYEKLKVAGVWVNVVTADLNDQSVRITPAVSRWGIGGSETFRSMIRRTRPAAAIDGTFFCTRTLRPTGDIVIDGQLIYRGYLGTAVAFNEDNYVKFVSCQNYKWTDYNSVLVAGPSLLLGGMMAVMPWNQGFRSGVHYTPRTRTALGLTSHNKFLMVTTQRAIYLSQLARVMKALGCVDAAGLDGGSSTALYYKGKLIKNPGRSMTNCLLIYDNPDSYEQHRSCFYPTARYSKLPNAGS